jgi:hypothetical protein
VGQLGLPGNGYPSSPSIFSQSASWLIELPQIQGADEGDVVHAHDVTFDWADLSVVAEAVGSWAHNGIVVTHGGELIGFHAGHLVAFDRDGRVSRSVKTCLTEGHGITLVREGDDEALWVSDPGFVFEVGLDDGDEEWAPVFGKGVHVESSQPRVVKMSLDGEWA